MNGIFSEYFGGHSLIPVPLFNKYNDRALKETINKTIIDNENVIDTSLVPSIPSLNVLTTYNIGLANPMLYVVNTFREGMLGTSDVSITFSLSMIVLFIVSFSALSLYLLKRGTGIREWPPKYSEKMPFKAV